MIKAEFDRPKLEKSLREYARQFGDTTAQAVIRWSVQTCREMAFETLPWGGRGGMKGQKVAIARDLGRVVYISEQRRKSTANHRRLTDVDSVVSWMDENRGKNHRTKKLPMELRKACSQKLFNQTLAFLSKRIGIAKGGFIGAGMKIAAAQRGGERIPIKAPKYVERFSRFGSVKIPSVGFNPTATIHNKANHTATEYVLPKSKQKKAIEWGLKKTVKWYSSTLKAQDKKQKV